MRRNVEIAFVDHETDMTIAAAGVGGWSQELGESRVDRWRVLLAFRQQVVCQ